MDRRVEGILLTDVAGYSKLAEPQLRSFMQHAVAEIAALFDTARDKFTELNTWGDAIVAVGPDPYLLARVALDLRDFFRNQSGGEN